MVTSVKNLSEANPDVLEYSQVTGCDLDVDEHRNELKQPIRMAVRSASFLRAMTIPMIFT